MSNNQNRKKKKKNVRKFWKQNQVILGWFACLTSFRVKSHEFFIRIFLSRIDKTQQENDW